LRGKGEISLGADRAQPRKICPTGSTNQAKSLRRISEFISTSRDYYKNSGKLSTPIRREVSTMAQRLRTTFSEQNRQNYIFQQGLKTWWFIKVTAQQPLN
jgi:ATP phosphoribosyltransferase